MRNSELDQLNRCSSVAIELGNGNTREIIGVAVENQPLVDHGAAPPTVVPSALSSSIVRHAAARLLQHHLDLHPTKTDIIISKTVLIDRKKGKTSGKRFRISQ